ncbi:MAG: type II toxin-antitoxin system PemK/MazF family toxin, partial [Tumebacillaceae bacterium]
AKKQRRESSESGQDAFVSRGVARVLDDSKEVMEHVTLERTVSFILDADFWNQYGVHGAKKNRDKQSFCGLKFKRGQVVQIDLGHLVIGSEEAFMHTAIIVGDFKSLLVVVPISTDRSNQLSSDVKHAILPMSEQEYTFLDRPSYLNVHQIRVVSKNRLYRKKSSPSVVIADVKNRAIMKALEEKIIELYAPYARKLLSDQIVFLQNEVAQKDVEIEQLKQALKSFAEVASTENEM